MTASTTADPNFAILTSLRYDEALVDASGSPGQHGCPLYMPVVHRQRLVTSWHALGWDEGDERGKRPLEGTVEGFVAWVLGEVREWQGEHEEQLRTPLKIRLAVIYNGESDLTISPVAPIPLNNLYPPNLDSLLGPADHKLDPNAEPKPHTILHLDTHSTTPPPHNAHKSTHRDIYTAARARASITDSNDDVLLFNTRGEIMETSISTVYFKLGGQWVTPSVESGCQTGTTRRWALGKGLSVRGCVDVGVVREGMVQGVVVSNGVRGFTPARLVHTLDQT